MMRIDTPRIARNAVALHGDLRGAAQSYADSIVALGVIREPLTQDEIERIVEQLGMLPAGDIPKTKGAGK